MKNARQLAWILTAAVLSLWSPAPAAAQSQKDLEKVGEKIVNFAVPGLGTSMFTRHAKVPPWKVEGKWVYALALRDEGGSRCTHDFDAKWKGKKRFRAYVLVADPNVRATIAWQRKGNKKWGPDSNRGPIQRHRDWVELDGGRNYLADRGFGAGDVLRTYPHACVVFLEEGLSFERFQKSLN